MTDHEHLTIVAINLDEAQIAVDRALRSMRDVGIHPAALENAAGRLRVLRRGIAEARVATLA